MTVNVVTPGSIIRIGITSRLHKHNHLDTEQYSEWKIGHWNITIVEENDLNVDLYASIRGRVSRLSFCEYTGFEYMECSILCIHGIQTIN